MQRRKPGRPPKGRRTQVTVRIPSDHLEVYRAAAASRGIPTGDYIAKMLAEAHGWPEPDYIHNPDRAQEALPISA